MRSIFSIFLFLNLLFSNFVFSEEPFDFRNSKDKKEFLTKIQKLGDAEISKLHIQLLTMDYATTVTTAFGHSAVRMFWGKEFEDNDYFIDFGEYDESAGFIWRFLKGEAKFYITIRKMAEAYSIWDTTGRGMYASEFQFDAAQKKKFLQNLLEYLQKYESGYFYDNFSSNCVTYIRDLVSSTIGQKFQLEANLNNRTWRSRLLPYSNRIFWLRIEEKLLLDYDTDKIRDPFELIYLPYDLLFSLEDAKIVKEKVLLHRNFWKLPEEFDMFGTFCLVLTLFIVISQLPFPIFLGYRPLATKIFAVVSTIGGLFVLVVKLFTSFNFMNDTITYLLLTPLDLFLLFGKRFSNQVQKIYYTLRVLMCAVVVVLRFTIYPQKTDLLIFFVSLIILLLTWNFFREQKTIDASGSFSKNVE